MFKIVFRDSSLYAKQLSLFCLLRLINASADPIGHTANFCSMIELLHELKKSSCYHRSILAGTSSRCIDEKQIDDSDELYKTT